ncbi:type I-E CRISPR-associated protein Cas5/CasD [Corynebacterium lubricantis]|uniref:type I-E CRISPR-associated protein Cas5/CasD n=1 Tax=Corynebacterium lubricantis TaxID=541095 RepID=UPI0003A2144C|nr:type I-E CRISPR-associated protein Cas5/CasD [Corynebacterium lubricantis]
MTSSLLLLLKGPLQSWGDQSRYGTRATASTPSKSGIIGMVAAAQGRRRSDPIEDLADLNFAVRIDQSGALLRDYQTAQPWQRDPNGSASLVTRYYLQDAAFVAAIEAPDRGLLESFRDALNNPTYPLFLGRRSCPAPPNLVQGIVDKPAAEALMSLDQWFATMAHKKSRNRTVELPIYRDALPGETGEKRQDVPVSFDSAHRQYNWREVVYAGSKTIDNEHGASTDPFFEAVVSV